MPYSLPVSSHAAQRTDLWRYAVAVATVAAALLLSELLRPIVVPNPFLFVFGAIVLSAGYGGLGPGLLATALAVTGVDYLLFPPFYTVKLASPDLVRLGAFAAVAVMVSSYGAARRRAEAAAQQRGEQLQVTLASIGDAVIATDAEGRVTFLNDLAVTLTGWTVANATGRSIDEVFRIVNADTRLPVESPVARVLREGMTVGLANHTVLLARDGAEHPIDDSGAPIRDGEGRLIGVVLVFRDITEREEADAARAALLVREQRARAAADHARDQLAFLAEAGAVLSASLDYSSTLRQVATLAVPRMGDWCAVDVLDEAGRLERLAVTHTDPAKVTLAEEIYRRYPPDPNAHGGVWHVIRTGEPFLLPSIGDDLLVSGAQDAEHLALLRALGMRAALTVPLLAGERILGVLTLVMAESGRGYDKEDSAVALSLGRRAGLAIEKAQLYAAEQRARIAAEQRADRLNRLQRVTGALTAALRPEDVARVVTEQCVQALGAKASAVMSYDPASRTLQLLHAVGYGEAFRGYERISIDGPYPFNDAVRDAAPLYVPSRAALNARYPNLAASPTITEAAAYLPLLVDGKAIGGLSIGFAAARELDAEERAFLETLTAQCAQALDRARLYAAEQRARERLAFLAEADSRLVASLDYQHRLEQLAQLCVPRLADWCAVECPAEDGRVQLEIIAHTDPAREQWARELRERFPLHMEMPVGSPLVMRTGEPLLYPEISDELIQQAAQDAEELRLLRLVGYRSMIVVPLRAHQRIIGALGLITTSESGRQYTAEDLTLAEELARRAGVALDNARLYQAATEARAAAEEAVALRDRFLSIASHELKTPLTSLLLQAQLLQRRAERIVALPERERRALEVITGQAERLDHMIADLLNVSRLELGQLSLNRAPLDLCALACRVVSEVQPTTESHIVTCTTPEDALIVNGDELRLEQVLQNLLQNAIKYSPDGGPVEVAVEAQDGQVCLRVSDRGLGIPEEALPRLFERFYRAPNADPQQISGMGIGLYVVKEIVRLHGGDVWAAHQKGGGSTFTVCLPQVRVGEGAPGADAHAVGE